MSPIVKKRLLQSIQSIGLMLIALSCSAIDNPDSPDYLDAFHVREEPYKKAVEDPEGDGRSLAEARGRYLKFLDEELNGAYGRLKQALPEPSREQLTLSQRSWVKFRDTEAAFIDSNWSPQNFGSSSSISRVDYRATIVRDRIEQLLMYLKNH